MDSCFISRATCVCISVGTHFRAKMNILVLMNVFIMHIYLVRCMYIFFEKSVSFQITTVLLSSAYETLSDDKKRREYDQMGRQAAFEGMRGRGSGHHSHQSFTFNFDDLFRDFDMFGQDHQFHQHSHQKRSHFKNHFQNQQREAHSRHSRQFQNSFAEGGLFDDVFENMEKMFSFNMPGADSGFHRSQKQHCRTVTQRRGNMVTTYTDCS